MKKLSLVLSAVVVLAGTQFAAAQQQQQPQQRQQQAPAQAPAQRSQPAAPPAQPRVLEPLTPPVIVVVDFQEVLRGSAAAKSIQQQLERTRATYQEDISKKERDLRAAEQELQQQRAVLAPEAFQQRRRDFETRVADVQRDVNAKKRQLDQAFEENIAKVREQLIVIVDEIAKETKANMVISKAAVVIVEKRFDLTSEALVRLDRKLTSVKLVMPALKQ
ncbi:MAG: OmpH family outer membrane protein [Alphaproteobacteria bacterium]|nr:OmpH family outer membrane protein [Alphaproteobacteria bacterium]